MVHWCKILFPAENSNNNKNCAILLYCVVWLDSTIIRFVGPHVKNSTWRMMSRRGHQTILCAEWIWQRFSCKKLLSCILPYLTKEIEVKTEFKHIRSVHECTAEMHLMYGWQTYWSWSVRWQGFLIFASDIENICQSKYKQLPGCVCEFRVVTRGTFRVHNAPLKYLVSSVL